MKNSLNHILLLVIMFSCTNNVHKDYSCETLEAENDTTISFYDLFTSLDIIPLETNDSSLLTPHTLELKIHENKIYIFDDKQMLLMEFDELGKHITTFDRKGAGIGEYTELYDFSFNHFTGNLEVLDPHLGINIYNKENYKFIKRINKPTDLPVVHRFIPINPNEYLLLCESKKGNKMAIYNVEKNKITSELYDIPKFLLFNTFYHHSYTPFYVFEDKIHFIQAYDGKVFVLENNELIEKYCWNFGTDNFKLENLPPDKDIKFYLNWDNTVGKNYATCFVKYTENDNYYLTQYRFKGKIHHLIYDKKKKQAVIFRTFQEGNFSSPTFTDENFAYSIVIPQMLEYYVNPTLLNNEGKEIFKNIHEDDNPVILKYKFRK